MAEAKSPVTRREVLKGGAAIIAAGVLGGEAHASQEQKPRPAFEPKPVTPDMHALTYAQGVLFSKGYTSEQKVRLKEVIDTQKDYILSEKYEHVPDAERNAELKQIGEYKSVIDQVVRDHAIDLDPSIQHAMLGIFLTESKGNYRESGGGLSQLSPMALEEVTKDHPEFLGTDIYTPYGNILMSAKYLEILTKQYVKPEFALWAFHTGGGRLMGGIKAHLAHLGRETSGKNNRSIIEDYGKHLSLPELIDSPGMQSVLRKTYENQKAYEGALNYVPRIIAGANMIVAA